VKIFAHPDPVALEAELLRGIAQAQREDALAGVLVVVPTARLARHVVRRLARDRGAVAGVEVLHHRRLLLSVLAETAGPFLAPLPETLHAALVRRILVAASAHPWARFVRERPGAIRAVLASLSDLREAAIPAQALRKALGSDRHARDLHGLYADYESALARVASRGFADEAGLVAAALSRIPGWLARFTAVFHHGAYELTGVHLELMRAIDRERPVSFLIPSDREAPAYATGEAFRSMQLSREGDQAAALDVADSGRLGAARLLALYREDAPLTQERARAPRPAALPRAGARQVPRQASLFDEGTDEAEGAASGVPLDSSQLDIRHSQGARMELAVALRSALAQVAAGTRPDEIAIVARTLEPYATEIEALLEPEALPASTSATAPLRRDPSVHDLLVLLRTVADDFPRRPTCELLASPRIRWERLLGNANAPEADLAESFSVEASIAGGFEEWTEGLPEWAAHAVEACEREGVSEGRLRFAQWRAAACRTIARAVTGLRANVNAEASARWPELAELVEAIARKCVRGFDDPAPSPAVARLLSLLGEMQALETVLEARAPVAFPAMLDWLDDAVNDATIPLTGEATEGVQILDAMQARGLTFRSVFVLGMNGGSFPRPSSEDPLLDDTTRRRIREALRCPIPIKSESDREERMLLALLLGSARDRIRVSWQRADEAGRAKPVSLALREIARLKLGAPDLARLLSDPSQRIPAHPAEALSALAREPGLLRPDEAELLAALHARNASDARRRLASARPDLDGRLALVEAVESFTPLSLEYDGMVGALGAVSGSIAVKAFETLGACALRYFFEKVLRVDEVRSDQGLFEFDPRETGIQVHDTLQRVYAALAANGWIAPERHAEALRHLPELVGSAWRAAAGSAGARLARRAPVLAGAHVAMWTASICRFVEEDLARLAALGVERVELEAEREVLLPIGEGIELAVHGRFDRVAHGSGATVVSDYKTGSAFAEGAKPLEMLRGTQLQVPLYSWMEERAVVELLQVRAVPSAKEKPDSERIKRFEKFPPEAEASFRETLRVVLELAQSGSYPPRVSRERCPRCPYESACRHDHPPTLSRLASLGIDRGATDPDAERISRYLRLSGKKDKVTLLVDAEYVDPEEEFERPSY
jgi:ATP-dependent helicase/nuclease subunit B